MSKRKQAEKILYDTLNIMDKSGVNTGHYKKMFSKMKDKEFDSFMIKFLKDSTQQFYLEIEPFEREASITDIKKAADYLKVPLEEYVYMPYASEGDTHIRTAQPVPVGLNCM